jgi:hypothetical protein
MCSVPEAALAIMRRLDRLHLDFPFAGSRMLRGLLVPRGATWRNVSLRLVPHVTDVLQRPRIHYCDAARKLGTRS